MDGASIEPPAKRAKLEASEASSESPDCTIPAEGAKVIEDLNRGFVRREPEMGITEYIKSAPTFFGVLKERFEDFMVNEIRQDGSIVRLTNFDIPPFNQPKFDDSASDSYQFSDEERARLQELCDKRVKKNRVYTDLVPRDSEKQTRKAIHHAIRQQYPDLVSEVATLEDDARVIRVKYSPGNCERINFRPENRYLKFVLYKTNTDTMQALTKLSRQVARPAKAFATAGLKDRRGITTQEVTIPRMLAEHLEKVTKFASIKWGNYQYTDKELTTGSHGGNHFTIALRHFNGTEEGLSLGMQSLAETGFVNYFGMQRFGSGFDGTHTTGRHIIAGRLNEALEQILTGMSRYGDGNPAAKAFEIWSTTKDAAKAKACFSKPCQENDAYAALLRFGPDHVMEAIASLRMSSLYLHAYQSWIWNRMTSYRISEFGLQPVVGDLVLRGAEDTSLLEEACDTQEDQQGKSDCWRAPQVPTVVTAENISKYTIHDVVLPVPGSRSVYPRNSVHDKYREALKDDDIDIDCFPSSMFKKSRDRVMLPGSYRHIVVKPTNVSFKVVRYASSSKSLMLTDWERIEGKTEIDQAPVEECTHRAAVLEFSLKTSCYATMAIREVCQVDTSQGNLRNMSQRLTAAESDGADKNITQEQG